MIYLRNSTRKHRLNLRALRKTAASLLVAVGESGSTLSLSFVGDNAMRRLNRESRGKDGTTDVLSFPLVAPSVAPLAEPAHRRRGDARDSASVRNRCCATFRSRPPGSAESWSPRFGDAPAPRGRPKGQGTGASGRADGGRAKSGRAEAKGGRAEDGLVPERMLGDIVISVDRAARQAAEYDATLRAEISRLMIHGVLHLLGHDHEEARERAVMEREERRLARSIGLEWPYRE